MSNDDGLNELREALRLSSDNIPLRLHLAESLVRKGRPEEAEKEYRIGLASAPNNARLKLGLANAFFQQGKNTQALVIVEDLIKNPPQGEGSANVVARTCMMHSRLLFRAGDVERAVRQYKKAIDADPAAADAELASRLGIQTDANKDHFAPEDELFEGKLRGTHEGAQANADVRIERPKVNFKDVGGMDALKEEIRMKIIHPLTHPELYKAYGKAIGGGILMYGPPGCGKTHLARATAGEIKASFISVAINDVLDMWIGRSERNLHELFDQARRNKPCVLFFDEVDALAASRSDMRHSAGRQLINQFLAEMDGIESSNDGLLILAATNAPWHLDSAFRRPGRFDRILFVPPPDQTARAAIVRIMLRDKPVEEIDHEHIGKKTENFSGADLKAVVDVAIEKKLGEIMKQGGAPRPLTTKDLAAAAGAVKPSTREWFSTARNYALYSNQGGLYDDILKYMKL